MKNTILAGALGAMALVMAACQPAANVASENVSRAADNFEVPRRISVYNGITGEIAMVMEGFCSLQPSNSNPRRIAIICKVDGEYIQNFLDRGDNTFVLTEQLQSVNASEFHYRTVFRPQSLIPDIDFQGSAEELFTNQNNDG